MDPRAMQSIIDYVPKTDIRRSACQANFLW